jgi:hypothetical protein
MEGGILSIQHKALYVIYNIYVVLLPYKLSILLLYRGSGSGRYLGNFMAALILFKIRECMARQHV